MSNKNVSWAGYNWDNLDIQSQLYRWKNLISATIDNLEGIDCYNCGGYGINVCVLCGIVACGKCMYKYFTHKDLEIRGVVL